VDLVVAGVVVVEVLPCCEIYRFVTAGIDRKA